MLEVRRVPAAGLAPPAPTTDSCSGTNSIITVLKRVSVPRIDSGNSDGRGNLLVVAINFDRYKHKHKTYDNENAQCTIQGYDLLYI